MGFAHHAAPDVMQRIFRSASRREMLGKHSKGGRRGGGLKILCIMESSPLPVAIDTPQNASRSPGSNGSRAVRPNS
jgi:hypothetical protein